MPRSGSTSTSSPACRSNSLPKEPLDLGAGSNVDFHARLNLGLRVRLTDSLWLGIHPFNPTYTRFDSAAGPTARLWTFPTMFETSFAF